MLTFKFIFVSPNLPPTPNYVFDMLFFGLIILLERFKSSTDKSFMLFSPFSIPDLRLAMLNLYSYEKNASLVFLVHKAFTDNQRELAQCLKLLKFHKMTEKLTLFYQPSLDCHARHPMRNGKVLL